MVNKEGKVLIKAVNTELFKLKVGCSAQYYRKKQEPHVAIQQLLLQVSLDLHVFYSL